MTREASNSVRRFITADEVMAVLPLGRTRAYKLMHEIGAVRVGTNGDAVEAALGQVRACAGARR